MLNLDTHVLIFSLTDDLSARERALIQNEPCGISAIVLWEIDMLAQRGRIPFDLDHPAVVRVLEGLRIWPLDVHVCRRLRELDFTSDPVDEIIAATSLTYGVPLLTRDKTIRRSKVVPLA